MAKFSACLTKGNEPVSRHRNQGEGEKGKCSSATPASKKGREEEKGGSSLSEQL